MIMLILSALSANSKLGMNPSNVHASLFNAQLPDFVSLDEINFNQIDLVISGFYHNNLHNLSIIYRNKCKVIDLSADFRIF